MTAFWMTVLLARLAWEWGVFWPPRAWCLWRHRAHWLPALFVRGGSVRCRRCERRWSVRPVNRFLARADALDALFDL